MGRVEKIVSYGLTYIFLFPATVWCGNKETRSMRQPACLNRVGEHFGTLLRHICNLCALSLLLFCICFSFSFCPYFFASLHSLHSRLDWHSHWHSHSHSECSNVEQVWQNLKRSWLEMTLSARPYPSLYLSLSLCLSLSSSFLPLSVCEANVAWELLLQGGSPRQQVVRENLKLPQPATIYAAFLPAPCPMPHHRPCLARHAPTHHQLFSYCAGRVLRASSLFLFTKHSRDNVCLPFQPNVSPSLSLSLSPRCSTPHICIFMSVYPACIFS